MRYDALVAHSRHAWRYAPAFGVLALVTCVRGRVPEAVTAQPAPLPTASGPVIAVAAPLAERDLLPEAAIDAAVGEAIASQSVPGAVVLIGRHDRVVFRRAYGFRELLPERVAMTTDTVFDLASLTKPIATATSIMLLVERGAVGLDDALAVRL